MQRRVAPAAALLCAALSLSAAQGPQTFTGVITDEMCPLGDHSRMQMGPTDAECARACVMAHGSEYVLFDGKRAYQLSDQESPDSFAGVKVRVVGVLDAKTLTIAVQSIEAAR